MALFVRIAVLASPIGYWPLMSWIPLNQKSGSVASTTWDQHMKARGLIRACHRLLSKNNKIYG